MYISTGAASDAAARRRRRREPAAGRAQALHDVDTSIILLFY